MEKRKLRLMTLSAMISAIVCIATMVIHIPAVKGYINAGDCIVNLSGWILPPAYSAIASGIGSMFADVLSGYPVYAPATLIIKSAMGLVSALIFLKLRKKHSIILSCTVASAVSEVIMVAGYTAYEIVLYHSLATALTGVFGNVLQSAMGIIGSVAVYKVLSTRKTAVQ